MSEKLTKLQREALAKLPDWIGAGLPASVVGARRAVLERLCFKGLAEKERPNEEWPNLYSITPAGRAALQAAPTPADRPTKAGDYLEQADPIIPIKGRKR